MKKFIAFLLIGAVMLFGLTACSRYDYDEEYLENHSSAAEEETAENSAEQGIYDLFTDFEAEDIQGNKITREFFADYELTLVNVWTTWCGPCKKELPALGEVAEKYADEGFAVLGILYDGASPKTYETDEKAVKNAALLLEKAKVDYKVIIPDEKLFKGMLSVVSSFPTSFFVDKEGNIMEKSFVLRSLPDADDWSEIIEDMLKRTEEK